MSVNEFVLRSAGEKLRSTGADFPGVYEPGDAEREHGRIPPAGANANHATDRAG